MVTTGCGQASSSGCEPLETLDSGSVKTREALEIYHKQLGRPLVPQAQESEVREEWKQTGPSIPPPAEGILGPDLWLVPRQQAIWSLQSESCIIQRSFKVCV